MSKIDVKMNVKCPKCGGTNVAFLLGKSDEIRIFCGSCRKWFPTSLKENPCPYLTEDGYCRKHKRFTGSASIFECKYQTGCIFGGNNEYKGDLKIKEDY